MGRAKNAKKVIRLQLFDRCSGGIFNLRFDSEILESFYSECSLPRAVGRFRFGTAFMTLGCLVWLLYSAVMRFPRWECYIGGLLCGILLSASCFGISFVKAFFKRHFLWISAIYSCLCSLLALLPFTLRSPPLSLAFNLSIATQLIVLLYTMIPLRLWQLLLVCGPLSLIQIILASARYGSIGASVIFLHIVAHVYVHTIGLILHLMSQVWRRSTFLHLGYNALMRKELKKEQELRDDMIRSLMPSEVAQEVMRDVGKDDDADEGDEDMDGENRGSRKKSRSRRNPKRKTQTAEESEDDMVMGAMGFSDEFEDDEDGLNTKKASTVSATDYDGQVAGDVEDAPSGSPQASLVPKSTAPPRAVTFRKFHVSQLENVSVLFADIVGFTKMSSNKSASHLVYLLNDLFGRFDRLCEVTGCEKIATLGDCYYCVAGCPNPVDDHAERAVEMGRAMCLAIQQFDEDHKESVNMRVGVHTGKVICGLVGTRRFKFDVWSNDVTLANEMESTGHPGKVHISEATYGFVKDIYEVSDGEAVPDIRKFKVLVEFFNKEEQCFAIKHTQDEAMIKTFFIEKRFDGKPVYSLPPIDLSQAVPASTGGTTAPSQSLIDNAEEKVGSESDRKLSTVVSAALNERHASTDQKPAPVEPVDRRSDVQMLEALKSLADVEDVFIFPPISPILLYFYSSQVEACYRRLGLMRPKGMAIKKLSWSTPRIAPLINASVAFVLFITILISCFVVFPDSRMATPSPAFYITATIALVLQGIFVALLFADLAAWIGGRPPRKSAVSGPVCDWRRCVLHTYFICFRWRLRNFIGALFLVLPALVILSNFNGSFFNDLGNLPLLFVAHYRILFGIFFAFMLFHFTLFSSFSSWTKSLAACIACTVAIILIALPKKLFIPSPVAAFHTVWNSNETTWDNGLYRPWTQPALHADYVWEISVVLLVTFALVAALNREFDISFRLSFHRDFQALEAKQAIAQQKVQADWLLENIIPYYIMDDLRRNNKYSKHIVDAGVVFATISNFAEFYDEQYQGGQEMLRVLNEIFADFEHQLTSAKYKDVEKIKTIGACFMAASGLNMIERGRNKKPDAHLYALMDFAIDVIHTLDEFNRQMFNFQFEMKVGYNVGEVTAGVIGTTKLLYDIWGDTVNVASRMYSTGQKGRIQVTEAVAKRLESRYVFEYRGEVFVKGKGDMKTYLLCHRRTE
ncbi:hypothetical protein T265_02194 [Opisthorchis viverrini]|uniref:adenylate cyclase n=1 Tax=Opisthorchis viverrini TaxID=6198 RepID=A0A074ZWP7_OPIVI|nr:hypothetical protein T265_02194 [Opisthorchis viverrini]KER31546.1 hypothetical protein T265_02194 [Opisthorchis viverrini]